jgi:hypothetical protein
VSPSGAINIFAHSSHCGIFLESTLAQLGRNYREWFGYMVFPSLSCAHAHTHTHFHTLARPLEAHNVAYFYSFPRADGRKIQKAVGI